MQFANAFENMGLSAGDAPPAPSGPAKLALRFEGTEADNNASLILTARIEPDPEQPRKKFDPDKAAAFARNVETYGITTPIRVRYVEAKDKYIIISGERRWRAATAAGLRWMPCQVVEDVAEARAFLLDQLVENLQRDDMTLIDQAGAFRQVMRDKGWTATQLAANLQISDSSISRAFAVESLPPDVKDLVRSEALAPSVAAEVARIDGDDERREVAARIVAEDLSRKDAKAIVDEKVARQPRRTAAVAARVRDRRQAAAKERVVKLGEGFVVTVRGKRGIDDAALVQVLKLAVERCEANING